MDINILSTFLGVIISTITITAVLVTLVKKMIIIPMLEPLNSNIQKLTISLDTLTKEVRNLSKEQQSMEKKQQENEIKLARIDERVKNML